MVAGPACALTYRPGMTPIAPDFDDRHFRKVLGRFPTGVTIITGENADANPLGLTISSFHSLSLEPPLILWTLTRAASSLPHFRAMQRYVVHILSASQATLARRFARGPQKERFDGITLCRTPSGTPMLDDDRCAGWLECFNLTQHEAGDHVIFVGQVERCHYRQLPPLIHHAGSFALTPEPSAATP